MNSDNIKNILSKMLLIMSASFAILILYISYKMGSFLIPIILAFFTAFLLQPFIKKLRSFNISHWLSTVIVIIVAIIMLSISLLIILFYLQVFLRDFPFLSKTLQKSAMEFINSLAESDLMSRYVDGVKLKNFISQFVARINFNAYMMSTMTKTLNFFKDFFFYLVALIFILPGMNRISIRISMAFPKNNFKINNIINNITLQIQKYVFVKSIMSMLIALSVFILCFIFKIKYFPLLAFIAFLCHFIPYIGAISSLSLIFLFSFLQYQSIVFSLCFSAILIFIYAIFSEILEPKFQSKGVNLSPIVIFTSILVCGYIWGIFGIFLAVPIMSAFNVICENVTILRPISLLISRHKKI